MPKVLEDLLLDCREDDRRDPQEFRKMDFFRKGKEWLKKKMWSESFWKSESKRFYPYFQPYQSVVPLKILNREAKSLFFNPKLSMDLERWLDYLVLRLAYRAGFEMDFELKLINSFWWKYIEEQRKLVARAFLRKVITLHLNPEMWIDKTFESFKYLNLCEEVGDLVLGRITTLGYIDPDSKLEKLPFIEINSYSLYFFGYDKKRKKLVLGGYGDCEEVLKLLKDYELFVRILIRENLRKNSEREEKKKCSTVSLWEKTKDKTAWRGIREERMEWITFEPPVKLTEEDEKEIINFFIRKYDLPEKYKVRLEKGSSEFYKTVKTTEFRKSKKEKVFLMFYYKE